MKRKGIFLLPSLITLTSLFIGVFAISKAYAGDYSIAAMAVLLCVLLDGLDGNIARATNTVSRFGAELDSLTDAIVFGCVPVFIIYQWSLTGFMEEEWLLSKLGWLSIFLYIAATVLRLARFNVQQDGMKKYFFRGMPCPAAATLLMSFVLVWQTMNYKHEDAMWISFALIVVSSIAMLSNLSYFSLKQIDFKRRVPFLTIVVIICVAFIVALDVPKFLFILSVFYLCSGPGLLLTRLFKKHRRHDSVSRVRY